MHCVDAVVGVVAVCKNFCNSFPSRGPYHTETNFLYFFCFPCFSLLFSAAFVLAVPLFPVPVPVLAPAPVPRLSMIGPINQPLRAKSTGPSSVPKDAGCRISDARRVLFENQGNNKRRVSKSRVFLSHTKECVLVLLMRSPLSRDSIIRAGGGGEGAIEMWI
jgi:hypothetical protein